MLARLITSPGGSTTARPSAFVPAPPARRRTQPRNTPALRPGRHVLLAVAGVRGSRGDAGRAEPGGDPGVAGHPQRAPGAGHRQDAVPRAVSVLRLAGR